MKMNFRRFNLADMAFTKIAVMCATLFLVSAWQGFANWVVGTHWAWFLAAGLLLAIKPMITVFKK